jgi:hypothetical protein
LKGNESLALFAGVAVDDSEAGPGHGEVGVEVDGLLVVALGFGDVEAFFVRDIAEGVGAEGFEGGGGGLAEGGVELLDGAEGFTETGAHVGGDLADDFEDVVFVGGLTLLMGEGVAAAGVYGGERDDVGGTEFDDAAGEDRFDALAFAHLAGEVGGEGSVGALAEVVHGLAKVLLADEVEDGGLLELDGEGFGEDGVEYGVAGFIVDAGENNGVFGGEGGLAAGLLEAGAVALIEISAGSDEDEKQEGEDAGQVAALGLFDGADGGVAKAVVVVVDIPEWDIADAFEGEGAETAECHVWEGAEVEAGRISEDDLGGGGGCFSASGSVDVCTVPGVLEEFGSADVDADAEAEWAVGGEDGLGGKAGLDFCAAEDGFADVVKGEKESIADGHDLFASVGGEALTDELEVTGLDGVEVVGVAERGGTAKGGGAFGRRGADDVCEDKR